MKEKTKKFIQKAISIHGNQYDYSEAIYLNIDTKLKIHCSNHGIFLQTPYHHLNRKQGCPVCGIEKSRQKRTKPFLKFITQAKEIHGEKYDYSKSKLEYKGAHSKITITCKIHGDFHQTPDNHINDGKGCYLCGLDGHSELFSRSQEEFLKLAKKIHGNKYDYSFTNYRGADRKVTIVCKKHGKWSQFASSHLKGHNCPKCTGNSGLTKDQFIEKAISQHGNTYDYNEVKYINARKKVKIKCHIHGFFNQTPNDHIYSNGKGCPKCKETTGERKIRLFLEEQQINYQYQKRFEDCIDSKILPFDFYLPELNTLIEFDGIQHFEEIEFWGGKKALKSQQKRDKIKEDYARRKNYNLLRIKYFELDQIENKIREQLKLLTTTVHRQ